MSARSRRSRLSPRTFSGVFVWLIALVMFAGLLLPLVHVNRFRSRIQAALESSLGRRVQVGDVGLTLLPAPGFRLDNVIVGEDPAFGAEHFVYTNSMQVRLRLRTLWTGHVQIASLTLIEPSLNLVKNAQGRWNFEALLQRATPPAGSRTGAGGAPAGPYFPYIGIQDGRINFKFGDYKSVFHFDDVEAALSPARDAEARWRIRFAGRPARADRLLSGMGLLKGEGDLAMARRTVALEVALENSPAEYLLTLVYGRDFGLHGELGARAQLTGEVSSIDVQGILRAADFHRWDLLPSTDTRFSVPFHGRWSLPAQKLDLETAAGAVRVHLGVEQYLAAPRWNALVALERAPAGPFLQASRHLGAAVPAGLELHGTLEGALQFENSFWPTGEIVLDHGQVLAPNVPAVTLGEARAEIAGPSFSLSPVIARVGKEAVEISAEGDLREIYAEASISARGLRLAAVRPLVQALNTQWLSSITDGTWDGRISCRKRAGQPAVWTGSGALTDLRWLLPGVEAPIRVQQARVRWQPGEIQLDNVSGALGRTRFTGSCRQSTASALPARDIACRVRLPELDITQLGGWLNAEPVPTRWETWKRMLRGLSPATPSWLRSARIQGTLAVGSLRVGKWEVHNVRSEAAWHDEALSVRDIQGELERVAVSGALQADFSGASPRFSLQASARGVDFKSLAASFSLPANFQRGTFDVQLALSSAGRTAEELRAALQGGGRFQGHSILLENVEWQNAERAASEGIDIRSLDGRFELTPAGLDLTQIRMAVGKETYEGRGTVGGRPSVLLDLACKGKQSRLIASVHPETTVGAP
jgi:hypothetical protein